MCVRVFSPASLTWFSREFGAQPAMAHTDDTSGEATDTLRSFTTKNKGGPTRMSEARSLHKSSHVGWK